MERLDSTWTALGLFRQWHGSTQECSLSSGDTFAIYTDGLTESLNDAGEEFGEQSLIQA